MSWTPDCTGDRAVSVSRGSGYANQTARWSMCAGSRRDLFGAEAFHRLAGEFRDQVEVLIHVEHRLVVQFSSRGNQQIRDGRRAMLSPLGHQALNLDRSILGCGGEVLDRHCCQGW